MKQGIDFLMAIRIGIDLDQCEKVELIFTQGEKERYVVYPSDEVVLEPGRMLLVKWSAEQTRYFEAGKKIELDTRITLKDTDQQPATNITTIVFERTNFKEAEQ